VEQRVRQARVEELVPRVRVEELVQEAAQGATAERDRAEHRVPAVERDRAERRSSTAAT
jgi:hypothetical protein